MSEGDPSRPQIGPAQRRVGWLRKAAALFPPLAWLPSYQANWLPRDVVAGLTLAAYAIPVSLAYASLAGLPAHYGAYCYLAGGLAYAVLGSSRQLAMGPTSALAMLVGSTIGGMAPGDPQRSAAIAALTAVLVAAIGALAWLLRLSGLVNFISETILVGFKAGAALTIALTQLPKLFGVPGGGDHFLERVWLLGAQLGHTKPLVLGLGLAALALLLLGDKFLPGRPVAIIVVVGGIALASFADLAGHVPTVGPIPPGLPNLAWPAVRLRDIDGAIPLAAACFLLAYVEGISAARSIASRHGDAIDPRQELLALGAANLAVAVSHGFPVAGGLSQSAVNDQAGARTPLALVFSSVAIAICLVFFTGLLRELPTVILAAIVLVAIRGLVDTAALRRLWRVSRFEFSIALVALCGVLLLGILKGVLLAVIVSLLMLLAVVARPHVAFLGRIPGTSRFTDRERHPENQSIPGALIFRVEASLLYFNTDHVGHRVWATIKAETAVRLVVCDLSNSPHVDVAGAAMLATLHRDLKSIGIQLRIVEAHSRVRQILRAEGLEQQVGYLGRHMTVDQAIAEFAQATKETP
jgi:high affinity sulfate transporter 1